MKKIYEYLYPTTEDQLVFTPINVIPDNVGANIPVLINGTDTIEATIIGTSSAKQLQLVDGLTLADYLVVPTTSTKTIVLGDYTDVMFKRYGSTTTPRLKNNQRYTGTITIKVPGDIFPEPETVLTANIDFTSRFDPFYTQTKLVQSDVEHIVTISNSAVDLLIYDQSYKILIDQSGSGDLNYSLPIPYLLSDPTKIPYNIQQYVRYRVDYDIINAVYMTMMGKIGLVQKQLGEMLIQRQVTLPSIRDYLAWINSKIAEFPLTGAVIARSVIKGSGTDTWQITSPRRSF